MRKRTRLVSGTINGNARLLVELIKPNRGPAAIDRTRLDTSTHDH